MDSSHENNYNINHNNHVILLLEIIKRVVFNISFKSHTLLKTVILGFFSLSSAVGIEATSISRSGNDHKLKIKKFNHFNFNPQILSNEDLRKNLNQLNYYIQKSYHQNIIYYNNLILALVVLVVLFSILVILEENDTFYNLSAIAFLLLITFNLIILIFSHNLARQFLIEQSFFSSNQHFSNHRYHF